MQMNVYYKFVVILSIVSIVVGSSENDIIPTTRCQKYYQYTSNESSNIGEFESYKLLQTTHCSADLELFLCTLYEPPYQKKRVLRPCIDLCARVKRDCLPVFITFNLKIPSVLQCDQYPPPSPSSCIQPRSNHNNGAETRQCSGLLRSHNYVFVERTNKCALKCTETGVFTHEARSVARVYLTALTILTIVSTSITMVTLLITKQLQFPQQPVLMICLSYLAHAISLTTGMLLGRERASCDTDPLTQQRILIQEGLENTSCALTFLVNFYFSVSADLWWLVLAGCWVLAPRGGIVSRHSGFVHLLVWALTAALTVCVLILRTVDADELLGLCYVGGQSPPVKLAFSLLPRLACLVVGGTCCLTALLSPPHKLAHESPPPSSSLARYSLVYMPPMLAMVLLDLYEYVSYDSWVQGTTKPVFELLLLKILASQLNGVLTIIWVCHDHTMSRIVNLYSRLQTSPTDNENNKSVAAC